MKIKKIQFLEGALVGLALIFVFVLGACDGAQVGSDQDPDPSESVLTETYAPQQNNCKNDGSELTITKDLNILLMTGGFDYLESSPDQFDGFVDEDNVFHFTFEGETSVTCSATLVNSVLYGTCSFSSQTCNFAFLKKPAE